MASARALQVSGFLDECLLGRQREQRPTPPRPEKSSHPEPVCKLERVPGRPALGDSQGQRGTSARVRPPRDAPGQCARGGGGARWG